MAVYAITRILHGTGDGVKEINVGDELSGFSDDELRSFIQGGSAVETGRDRKFTEAPTAAAAADEDTRKRDELLAKAASATDDIGPSASAPSATTSGTTTIGQVAADKK